MKKILLGVGALAVAALAVNGATGAWFTDTSSSTGNTFTAGTLNINLVGAGSDSVPLSVNLDNLAPGEERTVEFDVRNTGSLPVHLAGYALGRWSKKAQEDPENLLVKVVKVERSIGKGWEVMVNRPSGLTGEYYYSPNGKAGSLYTLEPNKRARFKLTFKLDETTGNEYQGKPYRVELNIRAKQTNAPVSSFGF